MLAPNKTAEAMQKATRERSVHAKAIESQMLMASWQTTSPPFVEHALAHDVDVNQVLYCATSVGREALAVARTRTRKV